MNEMLYLAVEKLKSEYHLDERLWRLYLIRCLSHVVGCLRGDSALAAASKIFSIDLETEFERLVVEIAQQLEPDEERLWKLVYSLRDDGSGNWPVSPESDHAWIMYLSVVSVRHIGLLPPLLEELPRAMSSLAGWSNYRNEIGSKQLTFAERDNLCVKYALLEEESQLSILQDVGTQR